MVIFFLCYINCEVLPSQLQNGPTDALHLLPEVQNEPVTQYF
jgi:hypothetical protein